MIGGKEGRRPSVSDEEGLLLDLVEGLLLDFVDGLLLDLVLGLLVALGLLLDLVLGLLLDLVDGDLELLAPEELPFGMNPAWLKHLHSTSGSC